MEFLKLDSTFHPVDTAQGFETLVWTERYREAGDFELLVEDSVAPLSLLPKGTFVSHTDTKEVMIVENHQVKRNSKKKLITTISGRSVESFAEHRTSAQNSTGGTNNPVSGDPIVWTLASAPSWSHAKYLLEQHLTAGRLSANEILPNIVIAHAIRAADTAYVFDVPLGDLYSVVLDVLRMGRLGIKSARPATSAANNTTITVHDGVDKRTTVQFTALGNDLEDATYFSSIKDYKNVGLAIGKHDARYFGHRSGVFGVGFNRRTLAMVFNDVEFLDPEANAVLEARGQVVLDGYQPLSLISAKISEKSPYRYKIHYDIGDLVTVAGEFGPPQDMQVTEHILTVDKHGIRGYPSLSAL